MKTDRSLNRRRNLHIFITLAVMAVIFIHSAMPGDLSGAESSFVVMLIARLTGMSPAMLSLPVRKAAHFTEYFVLGICLVVNVRDWVDAHRKEGSAWMLWVIPWVIATAYAVTDEIHQAFVPGRACTFMDVCIDAAGAAVGAVIMVMMRTRNDHSK